MKDVGLCHDICLRVFDHGFLGYIEEIQVLVLLGVNDEPGAWAHYELRRCKWATFERGPRIFP